MGLKLIYRIRAGKYPVEQDIFVFEYLFYLEFTPGPHLMRIHLVRYSTSARYEKYSIIHLVRPIIHLVRIFALSTS